MITCLLSIRSLGWNNIVDTVYRLQGEAGFNPFKSEGFGINEGLDKAIIGVAPTANVYQILDDQTDLSDSIKKTFSKYNYFIVELGLNVMLGREFKIPKLLLWLTLV